MDVGKIRKDPVPLTVEFEDGEACRLTFNRSALTTRFLRSLQALDDPLEQNARYLEKAVLKWNLTDGDDPLPVTFDAILDLPFWVTEKLVRAIGAAQFPNATPPPGE